MINKEIEEFNKFISNYDINNEAIKMKYNHTFRVVDYANKILVNETNDKDIVRLGLIGALLHDIARFKQ